MGRLFSLLKVNAVESMIFRFLSRTVSKEMSSNIVAFMFCSGSESKIPSTLVPLRITSALISIALKTAAESVVKKGFPVPPPKITTLPFSKCLTAFF